MPEIAHTMPSGAHVIGRFVHVMAVSDRILVQAGVGELRPVDPAEVFVLEAEGGETRVRLRSARPFLSARSLGDLETVFAPHGFLRIHRNHMVNLRRVRTIRRRDDGRDWELRLDPPVNRVLPISRNRLPELLAAFLG